MPEGRLGAWRWMLRSSDARRSTYRGAGVGVTLVRDQWSTSLSLSVDAWWAGVLLEVRREADRPVYDRGSLVARERAEVGLCPWTTADVSCGGPCRAPQVCGRPAWRRELLGEIAK